MVRLAAAVASVGCLAFSLSGCGGGSTSTGAPDPSISSTAAPEPSNSSTAAPDPSNSSTAAPGPSNSSTAAPPSPPPSSFTTQAPGGKTPLYVVMRMDDISPVDHAQTQADVISWFVDHKLKFNFGIIVGPNQDDPYSPYWPTTCQENAAAEYCNDTAVQRVKLAYENGDILGTGPDAVLELGNHAYHHDGWGQQWAGFVPNANWTEWQAADLNTSQTILKQLYPLAAIKFFAAPTNAASSQNLVSMKANGLEILTAAGTLKECEAESYYLTAPCDVETAPGDPDADPVIYPTIEPQCVPEGEIWATTDGFARVNGIVSAPAGAANSYWSGGAQRGVTVDKTVGIGSCGCGEDEVGGVYCSVIGSAKNNAFRSNGLHWTVVMMHPETGFGSQSYTEWLDEFYQKMSNLENYTAHFINFQDLAQLPAPGTMAESTLMV